MRGNQAGSAPVEAITNGKFSLITLPAKVCGVLELFSYNIMPVYKSAEEAAPPLPSCSITHYENGSAPEIIVTPSPLEKPKRNGTRLNEGRPTVETLLDELEGSVPSPR